MSTKDRNARIAFYANHGIGWVARPKHDDSSPDGFKRAGRFKKASNLNYGLALSLKMEKHLANTMSGTVFLLLQPPSLGRLDTHCLFLVIIRDEGIIPRWKQNFWLNNAFLAKRISWWLGRQ